MDSSYFNNRNYRREGNSHQYGIYGHYSNNINISNYEDPVFYNDYKKEKRSSISNFFSFSIDEDRNQSTVRIFIFIFICYYIIYYIIYIFYYNFKISYLSNNYK